MPAPVTARADLWRRHGLTILFGTAVVLLIALSLWWLTFLRRSVREQQATAQALLDRDVTLAAMRLPADAPAGPVAGDARLAVVAAGTQPLLEPAHWLGDGADVRAGGPGIARRMLVQPTAAYLNDRDRHFERQQAMVLGEGALLVSLLLAVVSMLFRLSRAESRFRREMQEFLGRMTHEMKTPLAGIKAVLETLRLGRMPADQAAPLATLALREVEREEHLIQNLLLAQRLRMPDRKLIRERIEVGALLAKFADHRRETMGDTATLAVDCAGAAWVTGDPSSLWTVLENLVDNALKYGGTRLQLSGKAAGAHAVIALTDNGMGFDPARRDAIFEPFAATKAPSVGQHGTGLGLSISRQLARQMGGDLVGRSEGPAQGATFEITLPLAQVAIAD